MKKNILWALLIISLIILVVLTLRVVGGEDGWICSEGNWVSHGHPNSPQPTTPCVLVEPIITNELSTVLIFFGNTKIDPNVLNCEITHSVSRQVLLSDDKYGAVIAELLQGPSEEETNLGFFTSINSGVKLPKIIFSAGVLTVDFDVDLEKAVGGSCRVSAIRSQITNTLKQFSEVSEVIIGRVADVLQP
jgi:hypothetical protein